MHRFRLLRLLPWAAALAAFVLVVHLGSPSGGAAAAGEEAADGAQIAWLDDLDAARAKAAEEGRPLCVVFR